MIKAKITSKTGASLEWELPANIHELHHALTEMGIRKTPRSLLLMDDNAAEVELTADSKIDNGLLRVFSKGDTLADANTVTFAVSTAREEILTDLEQNILHNQYLTKEMLFDDIKAMTQAAGPVKLTFYCPLVGQLDDGECDEYIDVGSGFLTAYQDQIEQGITALLCTNTRPSPTTRNGWSCIGAWSAWTITSATQKNRNGRKKSSRRWTRMKISA